jgi:hypothetical protein
MIFIQFKPHIALDSFQWHYTEIYCRSALPTLCHHNEVMVGSVIFWSTGNHQSPQSWNKHLDWTHFLPQSGPMSTLVQGALENLLGLRSRNHGINSGPKNTSNPSTCRPQSTPVSLIMTDGLQQQQSCLRKPRFYIIHLSMYMYSMCVFMFNKGTVTKQWQCQLPALSLWCACHRLELKVRP